MRDWKKHPPRRVASSARAARRLANRIKREMESERAAQTRHANQLFATLQNKIHAHHRVAMGSLWIRVRRVFDPVYGLGVPRENASD